MNCSANTACQVRRIFSEYHCHHALASHQNGKFYSLSRSRGDSDVLLTNTIQNTLAVQGLLSELVKGNRGTELAALTECPALMSGLPAEMQSKFRMAIIAKHAPYELAERVVIMEALNNAVVAADVAAKLAKYAARGRPGLPDR